ncbi:MAG: hypothetical protein V4438_02070 [Patescibacteria group bacterium]
MNEDIKKQLDEMGQKIEAIYKSVEKTRKYFAITFWITVIAFVLPLIGLAFAIPSFMSNYANVLGGNF